MLSSERIQKDRIFNPKAVRALVDKFKNGRANSTKDNMALVSVLSTQILIEQFIAGRGKPTQDAQRASGNSKMVKPAHLACSNVPC